MALPEILTSVHGRRLGLSRGGRLIAGNTDGLRGSAALVAYTNEAASTAITNTTTETLFSTAATINRLSLEPGTRIKIRWQGIATATNSTDTLRIRVRIGGLTGTVLFDHAATDVANNDVFSGECELIVRTVGAAGTFVAVASGKSIPAASGTATYKDTVTASTAINTLIAQVIGVTAQWSVANAGNSCRLDILTVEVG